VVVVVAELVSARDVRESCKLTHGHIRDAESSGSATHEVVASKKKGGAQMKV
jgi:hypothetical protein